MKTVFRNTTTPPGFSRLAAILVIAAVASTAGQTFARGFSFGGGGGGGNGNRSAHNMNRSSTISSFGSRSNFGVSAGPSQSFSQQSFEQRTFRRSLNSNNNISNDNFWL